MVVRQTVGKPDGDIYPSDVTVLSELYAWDSSITDLAGLEFCTIFGGLNLRNNRMGDVSPLVDNDGLGKEIWLI